MKQSQLLFCFVYSDNTGLEVVRKAVGPTPSEDYSVTEPNYHWPHMVQTNPSAFLCTSQEHWEFFGAGYFKLLIIGARACYFG